MPEIPLFVSSSQAGATQTGTFDVRFQPPLHIPEEAKNATIHIAHATIPFTEPRHLIWHVAPVSFRTAWPSLRGQWSKRGVTVLSLTAVANVLDQPDWLAL